MNRADFTTETLSVAAAAVLDEMGNSWRDAWLAGGRALGHLSAPDPAFRRAEECARLASGSAARARRCFSAYRELSAELNTRWDYLALRCVGSMVPLWGLGYLRGEGTE